MMKKALDEMSLAQIDQFMARLKRLVKSELHPDDELVLGIISRGAFAPTGGQLQAIFVASFQHPPPLQALRDLVDAAESQSVYRLDEQGQRVEDSDLEAALRAALRRAQENSQ